MSDDFEGIVIVETHEEEYQETEKGGNKGCMKILAILLVSILILSSAFPLARFIIRKDYERQVEKFPDIVCDNLSVSDNFSTLCDPTLSLVEFVAKAFPIGVPKSHISIAMKGFSQQQESWLSQPGCLQPEIWTYLVASSFIGWKTEVEFLFCSETLMGRQVLVDGSPLALPTYDL